LVAIQGIKSVTKKILVLRGVRTMQGELKRKVKVRVRTLCSSGERMTLNKTRVGGRTTEDVYNTNYIFDLGVPGLVSTSAQQPTG